MIGGGLIKIKFENSTNKKVLLFDTRISQSLKVGRRLRYEVYEIAIFEILIQFGDIIIDLIKKMYLTPDNINSSFFKVEREFWFSNGPLPEIIDKLITEGKSNLAYSIIQCLYNAYQFRETDNYNKRTNETIFKDHANHVKVLLRTLIKCIYTAKNNQNINGLFQKWVDDFYTINYEIFKDFNYSTGKKQKTRTRTKHKPKK